MYLVKRPFRDANGMVSAGSKVEPADIKRFKYRLSEGHIVEVNEHNFDAWAHFFKVRYAIDISNMRDKKEPEKASKKVLKKEPDSKPEKIVANVVTKA